MNFYPFNASLYDICSPTWNVTRRPSPPLTFPLLHYASPSSIIYASSSQEQPRLVSPPPPRAFFRSPVNFLHAARARFGRDLEKCAPPGAWYPPAESAIVDGFRPEASFLTSAARCHRPYRLLLLGLALALAHVIHGAVELFLNAEAGGKSSSGDAPSVGNSGCTRRNASRLAASQCFDPFRAYGVGACMPRVRFRRPSTLFRSHATPWYISAVLTTHLSGFASSSRGAVRRLCRRRVVLLYTISTPRFTCPLGYFLLESPVSCSPDCTLPFFGESPFGCALDTSCIPAAAGAPLRKGLLRGYGAQLLRAYDGGTCLHHGPWHPSWLFAHACLLQLRMLATWDTAWDKNHENLQRRRTARTPRLHGCFPRRRRTRLKLAPIWEYKAHEHTRGAGGTGAAAPHLYSLRAGGEQS
ncbi:hypothetical protein C8R44DRAFT_975945 [Mycena epipterygia]|nr:hypothetical protein C8R44DRAFT_975945 [Mycena epipterygia]